MAELFWQIDSSNTAHSTTCFCLCSFDYCVNLCGNAVANVSKYGRKFLMKKIWKKLRKKSVAAFTLVEMNDTKNTQIFHKILILSEVT